MTAKSNFHSSLATDPEGSAPTAFHGWSRLPTELKLEILSHHVPVAQVITWTIHREHIRNTLGTIFRTRNHELAALTLDKYYSANSFCVTVLSTLSYGEPAYVRITSPPPTHGKFIRELRVKLYIYNCTKRQGQLAYIDSGGWDRLLCPQAKGNSTSGLAAQNIAWRKQFPNLRNLGLDIIFADMGREEIPECNNCQLSTVRLHTSDAKLRGATMGLKAKSVEVRVQSGVHLDKRVSRCACTDKVTALITDMVTGKK